MARENIAERAEIKSNSVCISQTVSVYPKTYIFSADTFTNLYIKPVCSYIVAIATQTAGPNCLTFLR